MNSATDEPRRAVVSLWTWRRLAVRAACHTACQWEGHPLLSIDRYWKIGCVTLALATGTWHKGPKDSYWKDYIGSTFHDLRRTGLRSLISAGVVRDVARSISGHLTDKVFTRYNIVDESHLEEAGRQVVADLAQRYPGSVPCGVPIPHSRIDRTDK